MRIRHAGADLRLTEERLLWRIMQNVYTCDASMQNVCASDVSIVCKTLKFSKKNKLALKKKVPKFSAQLPSLGVIS